jgi:phosphatidylglycerol---prolipoprotein diacylglyceryl transferase
MVKILILNMHFLSYFYWDPNPEMFHIELPFLHRGILWYGFLFALGFFVGYWIFLSLLRRYFLSLPEFRKEESTSLKKRATAVTEKVTVYLVIGALVGARLGDILLYQGWAAIARDPLSLFKIWEGGLASHGAAVGIFLALWILSKRVRISFFRLLDLIVIPTALAGTFIRIGNFFNQEILGTPTTLPWGVVFGHPLALQGGIDTPRHPVQLYEAFWYALVFFALLALFKKNPSLKRPGRIAGWFFILVFGFRFGIEFLKEEQSQLLAGHAFLTMGQWLSIPMVFFGIFLLVKINLRRRAVS